MDKERINKFADVVLKIGVNLTKDQILLINAGLHCKEIAEIMASKAYDMGARRVIINWNDQDFSRIRYEKESVESLSEMFDFEKESRNYFVDKDVCNISIVSDNPDVFDGIDPQKMKAANVARRAALRPFFEATSGNKLRWCVCAYPEKAWAKKMFPDLSEEDAMNKLWDMICSAMRLDSEDPIAEWKKFSENGKRRADILNNSGIVSMHYKNSLGTDLTVGMMPDSIWLTADEPDKNGVMFMANLPTEEIFSAPDRNNINGVLYSALPLCDSGNIIDKFWLKFENGRIVDFHAEKGEEFLRNIIETDEGSHYLGEIALVQYDSPISNMKTLFYETLFDENASCHFAIGNGYPTCCKSSDALSPEDLVKHGLNSSLEHVDFMVGTSDLEVEAALSNGEKLLVMKDGNFVI